MFGTCPIKVYRESSKHLACSKRVLLFFRTCPEKVVNVRSIEQPMNELFRGTCPGRMSNHRTGSIMNCWFPYARTKNIVTHVQSIEQVVHDVLIRTCLNEKHREQVRLIEQIVNTSFICTCPKHLREGA